MQAVICKKIRCKWRSNNSFHELMTNGIIKLVSYALIILTAGMSYSCYDIMSENNTIVIVVASVIPKENSSVKI